MLSLRRFPSFLAPLLGLALTAWSLYNSFSTSHPIESHSQQMRRDRATSYFTDQFSNPTGVLSVLLLVGGDTVQKAVAQMTGGRHAVFTPVVFSFGWVAYAVGTISTAVGDAIFLPNPEHGGYVINVGSAKDQAEAIGSGDRRENRSWLLGRLIRDLTLKIEGKIGVNPDVSLIIVVYKIAPSPVSQGNKQLHPKKDWLWWSFAWAIPLQLGIGCVPWILHGDWSVFLITATGNLLATLTASLPSMRNVQYRKASRQSYALTRGNGHKYVFIVRPDSYRVDERDEGDTVNASSLPFLDEIAVNIQRADINARSLSVVFAVLWVMLLIAVGGLKSGTWYLFGAGTIGMVFNIMTSSMPRDPAAYGLPLEQENAYGFRGQDSPRKRVQEVLLELERGYPGAGHALKPLYFTGLPSERDDKWNEKDVSWKSVSQRLRNKLMDQQQNNQQQNSQQQNNQQQNNEQHNNHHDGSAAEE